MAIKLNTNYLSTNRGIIKIIQIVVGVILSSMLCQYWETHTRFVCFQYGQAGYAAGLNYVVLILNIIWFVLNLLNIKNWKFERIYAIICTILFFVALGIVIWYIIIYHHSYAYNIVAAVLIGVMAGLFLWDVQILQGEASN